MQQGRDAAMKKVGADKATALQGGRAKDAQLCRPGIPLRGQVSSP